MGVPWCLWGAEQGEGPTHGVPGGERSVDGCGRQPWCGMRVGGVGRGGRAGEREKPRRALRVRRLQNAERTVLPAVAQM